MREKDAQMLSAESREEEIFGGGAPHAGAHGSLWSTIDPLLKGSNSSVELLTSENLSELFFSNDQRSQRSAVIIIFPLEKSNSNST